MERILVIGSSGHARVVIDLIEQRGQDTIVGVIDSYRAPGEQCMGYVVLGTPDDLPLLVAEYHATAAVVAIGDNLARSTMAQHVSARCPELALVSLVHPSASVGRATQIGAGSVILAGAVIGPCCTIGRLCIINTLASLDHDSVLADGASLAPHAATGGGCQIGQHTAIGIGASLIHGMSVGEHSVIGAGATVLGPIPAYSVAYGTPARVIRSRVADEPYL